MKMREAGAWRRITASPRLDVISFDLHRPACEAALGRLNYPTSRSPVWPQICAGHIEPLLLRLPHWAHVLELFLHQRTKNTLLKFRNSPDCLCVWQLKHRRATDTQFKMRSEICILVLVHLTCTKTLLFAVALCLNNVHLFFHLVCYKHARFSGSNTDLVFTSALLSRFC